MHLKKDIIVQIDIKAMKNLINKEFLTKLDLVELNSKELNSYSGGSVSEFTEWFLNQVGKIAGEMKNKMHEDTYWYKSFTH